MNCRTVRMMAIAIGLCVVTAASSAMAKDKGMHGVVSAINMPKDTGTKAAATKDAATKDAAVPESIEITVTDKTKAETKTTYPLSEAVSVTVNGDPGKLSDIAVGDKIGFKLTDGKVSVITKGHKKKK